MTAAQPMSDQQPIIRLPFGRMLGTLALASTGFALIWFLATRLGPWPVEYGVEGLYGTGVSLTIALLGLLVMTPWKTRPIESWMTFWLGSTVLRLLTTPLLAFLVYSATSRSLSPFMLSVAASYLIILFSEASILALYVKRVTESGS